jgi:hypothetical protein
MIDFLGTFLAATKMTPQNKKGDNNPPDQQQPRPINNNPPILITTGSVSCRFHGLHDELLVEYVSPSYPTLHGLTGPLTNREHKGMVRKDPETNQS